MPEEDKYVKRHEWIEKNGKIYAHINEIDNKHVNMHNDLKLIVTTLSNQTDSLIKTGQETNDVLKLINGKMDGYNDRAKDVEYDVKTIKERVDDIEHSVSKRKKGNVQLWVAIIGALGTVIVGALGFAQLFF